MGSLGLPELIIVAIIALLIFGPKKLPDLGAGLGKAIRDFKGAINDSEPPQESAPNDLVCRLSLCLCAFVVKRTTARLAQVSMSPREQAAVSQPVPRTLLSFHHRSTG